MPAPYSLRMKIVTAHEEGRSESDIVRLTGASRKTVRHWVGVYVETGRVDGRKRNSTRKKLTEEVRTTIDVLTKVDRRMSCDKVSTWLADNCEVKVSPTTVWRTRHELSFKYRPPKKAPYLTPEHKSNRVAWATAKLHWNVNDWSKVVFSDESMVKLEANKSWLWYKRGEVDEEVFQRTEGYPKQIHIWGGIGVDSKLPLVRLSGWVSQRGVTAWRYSAMLSRLTTGVQRATSAAT